MSSNFSEQFAIAMNIGRQEGEGHYKYIKAVSELLDKIFNSEMDLEYRILSLHKLGLSDNKIDTNPKVEYYFRLLSEELVSQRVFKEAYQWQNLKESIDRCDYYIEEIARLISPTSMDIASSTEEEKVKTDVKDFAI